MQETKDAQDTSFEALKSRASNVSLEHVAAMEKARLLEENNTKLQEEVDKVLEERRSVDEMLISMGSKEQELKLELLQERETIKELSDNWDKRKVEIESLEKEKMELKTALVSWWHVLECSTQKSGKYEIHDLKKRCCYFSSLIILILIIFSIFFLTLS